MADDFKKYLATEILSEQRTISYRNVSRALKVHVNAAKCMLYEFHQLQQERKPQSLYATYLLAGVKKQQSVGNGTPGAVNGRKHHYDEDEPIPSSPPPFTSSMLEPSQQSSQGGEESNVQVPVRTITLVREEDLESVKEQYKTISSIHIYSLSPARIQDLVTLTEINRGLYTDSFLKEDPLLQNKIYGIIQNPDVRRRKGKRPVIPSGPAPKFQPVKEEAKKATSFFPAKSASKPAAPTNDIKKDKEESSGSRPSSRDSTSTTGSAKQPTLKRDSSDLFKAFAKQSQQKPKSTLSGETSQGQDTKMTDAASEPEEGESEDEAIFLDTGTRKAASKKRPSDVQKEREDRAAKLRKMMESDDEAEPAAPDVEQASGAKDDQPVTAQKGTDPDAPAGDEGEEVAWSDSDTEAKSKKTEPAAAAAANEPAGRQRRRGKRKVMKKRTTKDEDGYLVTKEEAVWESFSEDEPEPAHVKPAIAKPAFGKSQPSQSQGKAAGKAGAKKGGGNIMSFFGKKA